MSFCGFSFFTPDNLFLTYYCYAPLTGIGAEQTSDIPLDLHSIFRFSEMSGGNIQKIFRQSIPDIVPLAHHHARGTALHCANHGSLRESGILEG
jgi:hypothetical protein